MANVDQLSTGWPVILNNLDSYPTSYTFAATKL